MPQNEFMKESTILRTLTLPFRSMRILIFVILILFGSSIALQTYFHRPALLTQELTLAQKIGTTHSIYSQHSAKEETQQITKPPMNIAVTRHTYNGLYWLFFKATHLEEVSANNQFYGYIQQFNGTLKIISMRLGNAAIYIFYALFLGIIALIDGLNARKIRQANAARESASLYHRAKYLRTGILWSSIFLYLVLPIAINPQWLLVPVVCIALSVFMQAKYLKKYL